MNKGDKIKVIRAATSILNMWSVTIDDSNGDVWYKYDARQAYQDSLESMKHAGLISNYNVVKKTVTL
jgi:hypothetical protein